MTTHTGEVAGVVGKKQRARDVSAEMVPKIMRQGPVVPWLYLLPALIVMATFIVFPGLKHKVT